MQSVRQGSSSWRAQTYTATCAMQPGLRHLGVFAPRAPHRRRFTGAKYGQKCVIVGKRSLCWSLLFFLSRAGERESAVDWNNWISGHFRYLWHFLPGVGDKNIGSQHKKIWLQGRRQKALVCQRARERPRKN